MPYKALQRHLFIQHIKFMLCDTMLFKQLMQTFRKQKTSVCPSLQKCRKDETTSIYLHPFNSILRKLIKFFKKCRIDDVLINRAPVHRKWYL